VAKAHDTKEDRIVAIKEMKESVGTEGLESSVLRERSTLKMLKNNNIIE
jgi:serine/threonine protein kinase